MKRYRGKLFGATLGYSFGGPIGALIGAAVGHFFDSSPPQQHGTSTVGAGKELTFITSLIYLLVGTARADGAVTGEEIHSIKNFFKQRLGYEGGEYFIIERIIHASIDRVFNLTEVCGDIKARTSYEERLFLIRLGYEIALSDGILRPEEEEFIGKAADHLGIEQYDYMMIKRSFFSSGGGKGTGGSSPSGIRERTDPYTVLGVSPDCTDEEIQRAYRNMVNKYHPDRVSHLGKEFIDLATDKFNRIQEAYDIIKKERGLA